MNIAYDLLLLVFNISQFRSRNKLIEIFIEGMTEMFQPAHFYYFEKSEGHKGLEIEVRTRNSLFGFVFIENENSLSEENKILIINSVQMLAVILERLKFEEKLQVEKESLEQIAGNQLLELQSVIKELKSAREASIKLIEDLTSEIEKRKKFESELGQSEERYRMLAMHAPVGIAIADREDNILYVNQRFTEIFGYTISDIPTIDKWWKLVFPDEELRAKSKKKWDEISGKMPLEQRALKPLKFSAHGKDGSICQIELRIASSENIHYVMLSDISEQHHAEEALRKIAWMLSKNRLNQQIGVEAELAPVYGDLTSHNTNRLILDSVGGQVLKDIAKNYLSLLDTSSAVYEKNGDYALGIFSSGWCRYMDNASRNLCKTDDNVDALASGKWLCHESCWKDASLAAIETGKEVDIECAGGIRLYAEPIKAGDTVIGAINFGYGDPPLDMDKLSELSRKFNVPIDMLFNKAKEYDSKPPYIIELAKDRLKVSSKLIGEIVSRRMTEKQLIELNRELEQKVEEKTKELKKQVTELERFHDATIEREFRIKELKDEIIRLKSSN